jgi:hypothetical protein
VAPFPGGNVYREPLGDLFLRLGETIELPESPPFAPPEVAAGMASDEVGPPRFRPAYWMSKLYPCSGLPVTTIVPTGIGFASPDDPRAAGRKIE